ncbi:MAG: family 20 glycosylhydrolase [Chthoniobacterales bacterium]
MHALEHHLLPRPQSIVFRKQLFRLRETISIRASDCPLDSQAILQLQEDLKNFANVESKLIPNDDSEAEAAIHLEQLNTTDEAYRLTISPNGIRITGSARGIFYAIQTFAQILANTPPQGLPCCEIDDAPRYAERSVMLDLGRAPYSFALIQRIITILARLKLNTLHLHLNDDQLCGLRFEFLPLGSENPFALTLAELAKIVRFGKKYHVKIIPEFESWGHAGSTVFHYPHLYGGPGRWEGVSFGIGQKLYPVLRSVYAEILSVCDRQSIFHVGMDEAIWTVLPGENAEQHSPQTHLLTLHQILREEAENQGKDVQMRMWWDHQPMTLPEELREHISVEPWAYNRSQSDEIARKVKACSQGGLHFMMGVGMSSLHLQGAYDATRTWCFQGRNAASAEGVNMCIWETNDFSSQLFGIFVGADYAWHPRSFEAPENDAFGERERGKLFLKMRHWQNCFSEANPVFIDNDRGREVYRGRYVWHEKNTPEYVAPTADSAPVSS